jgi:hypothetical protein
MLKIKPLLPLANPLTPQYEKTISFKQAQGYFEAIKHMNVTLDMLLDALLYESVVGQTK